MTTGKSQHPKAQPPIPAGIRDVAKAAGVSATTVSHALSGKGRVPPATVEKVKAAVENLRYRPNPNARALKNKRSGVLVLAIPELEGTLTGSDFGFFMRVIAGASVAALKMGSVLAVASAGETATGSLGDVPYDGAIIADPVPNDLRVDVVESRRAPIVTIGRIPGDDRYPWVDNDHADAVRMVLDELVSRGAERPALLTLNEETGATSYYADVLRGYSSWCADHGIRPVVATSIAGDAKSARAGARRLLRRKVRPDAIHAVIDELARAVDIVAREQHLRIPQDVSLSSLSVTPGTDSELPVLRIAIDPEEQGRRAVEALEALVDGRRDVDNVIVPVKLVDGRA